MITQAAFSMISHLSVMLISSAARFSAVWTSSTWMVERTADSSMEMERVNGSHKPLSGYRCSQVCGKRTEFSCTEFCLWFLFNTLLMLREKASHYRAPTLRLILWLKKDSNIPCPPLLLATNQQLTFSPTLSIFLQHWDSFPYPCIHCIEELRVSCRGFFDGSSAFSHFAASYCSFTTPYAS